MRSVYLILGCSLMFAAVMVMGLSLHSCRSKQSIEKSVQVDSMSMSAYKEELDSFAFRRLLERYNKHFSLEIRHYRPVKDSTSKVTDTYLEKQILLSHRNEKECDNTGWTLVDYTIQDSTDVRLSEDSEYEEEPVPKDNSIYLFLVLAIFLFFWVRR